MSITIYVPGRGRVDLGEISVDRAVREYDERLSFTFDRVNGHYAIFIKNELGKEPFPIFAFPDGIPHPEDAIKKLYKHDSVRHGLELLDEINRENAKLERVREAAAEEAAEVAAEAMESFAHGQGFTGYKRIYAKDGSRNAAIHK